jgi:hypothetical protein
LIRSIKLGGLGQVGDIAGVDEERRFDGRVLNLVDGFAQGRRCIGVGCLVKADMAVAELHEREADRACREHEFLLFGGKRFWYAAHERPKNAGPGPCHALKELAAA